MKSNLYIRRVLDNCINTFGLDVDIEEPSCMACGRYNQNASKLYDGSLGAWNRHSLQVCHVIPRALGGSDDSDNMVLLCDDCHHMSPDTTDTESMIKWIKGRQSYLQDLMDEIARLTKVFPISDEGMRFLGGINEEDKKLDKKMMRKVLSKYVSSHSGKISLSSFISAYSKLCKETKKPRIKIKASIGN
jgi:5-methylcytosine-specific restriction endonuclease McrA